MDQTLCTECCPMPMRDFTIHVRSFHPQSNFGLGGLFFDGDGRGYSTALQKPDGTSVTSRIHSSITFSTKPSVIIQKQVHSDPSSLPLGVNRFVYDEETGPHLVAEIPYNSLASDNCNRWLTVSAHHYGINRAVPLPQMLNNVVVPNLDTFYTIIVHVDAKSKTMDIWTKVEGDGFPNAEAFIMDETGKAVFLGIHQRVGIALTELLGSNHRFMFSSSLRISLDDAGHFGEDMGMSECIWSSGFSGRGREYLGGGSWTISKWNGHFENLDPSPPLRDFEDYNLSAPLMDRVLGILYEIIGIKPAF